jgi:hypothetical protein
MRFFCKQLVNGRWGIYRDLDYRVELLATIEDQPTAQYLVASLRRRHTDGDGQEIENQYVENSESGETVRDTEATWHQQLVIPATTYQDGALLKAIA